MNLLIVSKSFIVKESIKSLFENKFKPERIDIIDNLKDSSNNQSILDRYNLVFLELEHNNIEDLEILQEYKNKATSTNRNNNLKILVLNFSKDKELFVKSMDIGVDGYILDIQDEDDFVYIARKILSGKKFYDSELIKIHSRKEHKKINQESITKREREVVESLCRGLNNKDISKELNITEFTVKKHIGNILDKLNLKNRQDIIIYYR